MAATTNKYTTHAHSTMRTRAHTVKRCECAYRMHMPVPGRSCTTTHRDILPRRYNPADISEEEEEAEEAEVVTVERGSLIIPAAQTQLHLETHACLRSRACVTCTGHHINHTEAHKICTRDHLLHKARSKIHGPCVCSGFGACTAGSVT